MTVEEAQDFLKRMPDASLREALDELARQDPVIWCAYYRRLRGQPLIFDNTTNLTKEALAEAHKTHKTKISFKQDVDSRLLRHRPWLMEPLRDPHPHKIWQKGRQQGVSEAAYIEETWFLENHPNTKALHTFPREKNLKRFVNTRVDPSFEESPRMRSLIRSPDPKIKVVNGTFLKRIRDAYLILDSAWESELGEGVDADMVTLDERDRMNPGVENAFIEALKSSPYKLLRELSTPTLPDRGVARAYEMSDKRVWMVRCERCGMWQEMSHIENLIQVKDFKIGTKELAEGTYEYLCRKESCRGKLNRMVGRWVAKRPSVENVRGYHLSHMMCVWISATELMQERIKLRWPDVWMKYCLGLPAVGEGALLTEVDYEMACSEHDLFDERTDDFCDVVAGIDWGHVNWIHVQGRNKINGRRYTIGLKAFEDDLRDPLEGSSKAAERYLAPFEPEVIIADDGYGKDRNAYLRKRFEDSGTQFFACRYSPAPRNTRQFQPVWNEAGSQVLVDRTMWLKMTCAKIKARELGLPAFESEADKEGYAATLKEHLKALRPMRDIDEDSGELVETIASNGPDHFAHTALYCELAYAWLEEHGRLGVG